MKENKLKIPKFGFVGVCITKTKENLKFKDKINKTSDANKDELSLLKKEIDYLKAENKKLKQNKSSS